MVDVWSDNIGVGKLLDVRIRRSTTRLKKQDPEPQVVKFHRKTYSNGSSANNTDVVGSVGQSIKSFADHARSHRALGDEIPKSILNREWLSKRNPSGGIAYPPVEELNTLLICH